MDSESSSSLAPDDNTGPAVSIDCHPTVHYAFLQNAIPLVREIRLRHPGPAEHRDLCLTIRAEPAFAAPLEIPLPVLAPGAELRLAPVDLKLSPQFLAEIRGHVAGRLHVEVTGFDTCLARHAQPIAVLAANEWSGLESLPEILAAFVVPHDAAVKRILDKTADILHTPTGRNTLNAYADKSRERVRQQIAALYEALGRERIRPIPPPTSYETVGHPVRLPSEILEQRLASGLDLALFFAACCEQAGLHPMLFVHGGHAYAGCWLVEQTLAQPSSDDQQAIRKLVELEDVAVFELSGLTQDEPGSLQQAEALALPSLETGAPFRLALDVKRSRSSGILPLSLLPAESTAAGGATPIAVKPEADRFGLGPGVGPDSASGSPNPEPRAASRIDLWKSRLLDLSLRNRLLNFRATKGMIQILSFTPEHVEDELAADTDLKLNPRPKLPATDDLPDPTRRARPQLPDALRNFLREQLSHGRLHTTLEDAEHLRRLTDLYRAARLAMEENGTNTLYIVAGILEWRETAHSDRVLRAPLLLIPVELKRRSVIEGFQLRRLDEDTRLNITLMEMLRQQFQIEIPGLDPLPEDRTGVDVAAVFRLFREAVRDLAGWEVKPEIWLGQFSFTKFLLWKDLADRLGDLTRNRVVRHLVDGGGAPFAQPTQDILPTDLDERFPPSEVYCPRSADSSQLAAVMAAAAGHDFVLEGPPGTGKSQTITNLIAHCLAHGKRVLFVAEKRAALDVVNRRLKEEGLGPFCLELHSNKSGKTGVLAQFQESLSLATQQSPESWEQDAAAYQQARDDLNAHVRALHGRHPCGLSVYDCIDYLLPRIAAELVPLPYVDFLKYQVAQIEQCRQAARQLARRAQLIENFRSHPLRLVRATDWTADWSDRVMGLLQAIRRGTDAVRNSASALRTWLKRGDTPPNRAELEALRGIAHGLIHPRLVGRAFFTTPWAQIAPQLEQWYELAEERRLLRAALVNYQQKVLLALDLDRLRKQWKKVENATFLTRSLRRLWVRWKVSPAYEIGRMPPPHVVGPALAKAHRLREINRIFTETEANGAALLGGYWHNGDPRPPSVNELRGWGAELHRCIGVLAGGNAPVLQRLHEEFITVFEHNNAALANGPLGAQAETFANDWDALGVAYTSLISATRLRRPEIDSAPDHLGALAQLALDVRRGWPEIRPWCAWQRARLEAEQYGLESLCLAVEDGVITADDAPGCFERSFRRGLLRAVISKDENLRRFLGEDHQARIDHFRQLDDDLRHLTRDVVRARLAAAIPRDATDASLPQAELGLLRKEIAKKARHLPVRQLLSRIPNLMPRLKPCVLMSPLSVAQYLDSGYEPFDLVVFDEASQIPVWDAIGAIARGRQLIVVGDPKQLPPTNFFNRADEGTDEETGSEFEDLESILDELLSNGLRHKRLQWHYRSRNEGLIAFSNRHYYANDLLTFPSPDVSSSGVHFRPVAANYDKGRSRTNPGEAAALVAELVSRLRDPDRGTRSFGVVTFSQAQQQLVENLLDEQRRLHPEIERHFGDEPPVEGEPVFVKNLENVQGDERDVILFSICYGPDESGRVSMNFGPLNRDGGERRLNVAITRAKEEILVFSTLRSEQIDLSRSRARGVRDLKYFLEYAERGPRALVAGTSPSTPPTEDSDFEQFIANRLRNQGYEVRRHVGCSDYQVNLAVIDPSAPDRYVLGFEWDGRTYRDAATARDRDKLRQSVMEGLGWKLIRLWSADWWHDPARELKKLREALASVRPAATEKPTA